MFSGLAGALGSLSAGWITRYLQNGLGWSDIAAYRFIFALYAIFGLIKGALTLRLSSGCEPIAKQAASKDEARAEEEMRMLPEDGAGEPVVKDSSVEGKRVLGLSRATRAKVRTLSLLFGLDNLASGLVPL